MIETQRITSLGRLQPSTTQNECDAIGTSVMLRCYVSSESVGASIPERAMLGSLTLGEGEVESMGQLQPISGQRREYASNGDRSSMRATWHHRTGYVVISLWRGNECVATSHLSATEAARLSTFITGGLAEIAGGKIDADDLVVTERSSPWVRLKERVAGWGPVRSLLEAARTPRV